MAVNARKLARTLGAYSGRFAVLSQKHLLAFNKPIERILLMHKYSFFCFVLNPSHDVEEQHGKMG